MSPSSQNGSPQPRICSRQARQTTRSFITVWVTRFQKNSPAVGNKRDSAASHERLANEYESPVAGNYPTIIKKTKDNKYEQIPDSRYLRRRMCGIRKSLPGA